jgi:hypothetical protein
MAGQNWVKIQLSKQNWQIRAIKNSKFSCTFTKAGYTHNIEISTAAKNVD